MPDRLRRKNFKRIDAGQWRAFAAQRSRKSIQSLRIPLQTDAHPLRVIEDFAAKVKCRGNAPDRRAKAYALNEAVHAYESGFNVFSIDVGRGHDVLFMD